MQWLRTVLFTLSGSEVTPLSLILFCVILLVTVVASKLVRRGITRFFSRKSESTLGLAYAVGRIAQYVIFVIGIIFALDNVGIDIGALAAFGAVLTVGIGFGLQNIAQNFISGLILLIERPVQKGDFIVVGDVAGTLTAGTVTEIEMRATKVMSREGVAVIVPNSLLITGTVINQTHPSPVKRTSVFVGVAYGTDTELVRQTLSEIAEAHPSVLKKPPLTVFFRKFGDSALEFELAVWLDHPEHEPNVASDLRFAIERAFREKKIEIPFPQHDVHVRAFPAAASGPVAKTGSAGGSGDRG